MVDVAQARGVACPICGWSGPKFEPAGRTRRPNARCPKCSGLERHRAICLYLRNETSLFTEPTRLLHFAPEPSLRRLFEGAADLEYVTTDLEMPDVAMRMDIHDLLFRDQAFDFVLCSHVLEHVDDDRAAMREIRRVLRPGGTALILVPILRTADGRTFEDPDITTPEGRERAYGQADHVRAYGEDFADRARDAGLDVEPFRPLERWGSDAERYALYDDEVLFVGRRASPSGLAPAAAARRPARPQLEGAAEEVEVWFDTRISPRDALARPDRLEHYFEVGLGALRLIEEALTGAGAPEPARILDLPSGHGRVLRMLHARFPEAAITACDPDRAAVEFCERTFGVAGVRIELDLATLDLSGHFDLVWCGSLITRLPEDAVRTALRGLARHLAPGGLLVFTAHGARMRELLEVGGVSIAVEGTAQAELLRRYDESGFGFAPYEHANEGTYGFSLSSREWVEDELAKTPGITRLHTSEAAWDGRQDAYSCQRDPE